MRSECLFSVDAKKLGGILLASLVLVGCGGGSSSGTNPPPSPDYTLNATPSAVVIPGSGGSQTVTVSISPINSFAGTVSVTVGALPNGVRASPASFNLTVGTQQAVMLSAPAGTQVPTTSVAFQSSSGTLSHSASVSVTVTPPPDYSLSASPSSITISSSGGSQTVNVSVSPINSFASAVSVTVGALPAGVSASPSSFNLSAGAQQAVVISATLGTQISSGTVTFQSTSGTLSHSAQVSLSVAAETTVTQAHAPIRARFLPTDRDSWVSAYDANHKRFFLSDPYLNEIEVYDAVQEIQIGTITGPAAWGMDVSPLNGMLYVGTLWGDVYIIDPSTLAITKRYPYSTIGPNGYQASAVKVLSDGRLALLGQETITGSLGYNSPSAAVWDPTSNSLDSGANGTICPAIAGFNSFNVSGDRTRVLLASNQGVCSYDPVAKLAVSSAPPGLPATGIPEIIPIPGGKQFFLNGFQTAIPLYDASTAQMVGQISTTVTTNYGVVSLDGKTLYLGDGTVYDTTSLKQTGWYPTFGTFNISSIDATGLIFGAADPGAVFLDGTQIKTTKPTGIQNGTSASPNTGPIAGGTVVSGFASATITDSATLSQIYVGNVAGLQPSLGSSAQVTTPPSAQSGVVDLTEVLSDGGIAIQSEAFSYGPTILNITTSALTAQGGPAGIEGYGFGQNPQVTVGGVAATGISVTPGSIPSSGNPIYPPNVDMLNFTAPAGTAGTSADVTVTNSAGSATFKNAVHYIPLPQYFAVPGGMLPVGPSLEQGIYDSNRDLYYFTGEINIQAMGQPRVLVLSQTQGQWLTPITLPSLGYPFGIAESPDGTKMAISDTSGAIYVFNPDSPAGAVRYPTSVNGNAQTPYGLAITNSGVVYYSFKYTSSVTGFAAPQVVLSPDGSRLYGDGFSPVSQLDTTTGSITVLSSNNQQFWLDVASGQIHPGSVGFTTGGSEANLCISGDGSTLSINVFFADASLNPETALVYDFGLAAGRKLNQDGSLAFQSTGSGVEVFSRNSGSLLFGVDLGVNGYPVSQNVIFDPILIAKGMNAVGLIGRNGVSFADLSSLPIPSQDTQPFPDIIGSETKGVRTETPSRPSATTDKANYQRARSKFALSGGRMDQ